MRKIFDMLTIAVIITSALTMFTMVILSPFFYFNITMLQNIVKVMFLAAAVYALRHPRDVWEWLLSIFSEEYINAPEAEWEYIDD